MFLHLPMPLYSPEGAESGSSSSAPPSAASPTPDAGAAPTPATPSTPSNGAAPQSTSATGGLRDAESDTDFVIPDFGESDLDHEVVIPAQAQTPQPPVPETPAPPQQPAPEVKAPEAPVEANKEPQGQDQQPAPQPAAPNELGPAELSQQILQNRGQLIDAMAKEHFALSEQEVNELNDDAVKAVPKLLARTYLDAVSTMLQHVATIVPRQIEMQGRITEANNAAKNKFFEAWPALKGKDQEVARMASMYRRMNPQATLDDMIRDVGPIVMTQLKIVPPPTTNGQPAKPQPTPAFTPALGGGTTIPLGNPAPENPWAGLGADYD